MIQAKLVEIIHDKLNVKNYFENTYPGLEYPRGIEKITVYDKLLLCGDKYRVKYIYINGKFLASNNFTYHPTVYISIRLCKNFIVVTTIKRAKLWNVTVFSCTNSAQKIQTKIVEVDKFKNLPNLIRIFLLELKLQKLVE